MMPIWLQLVTAVSGGLAAGLLGIALVPYLKKLRLYPPAPPKPAEAAEAAGEERKPIMGGVLLIVGTVFALVLGTALYLQFGDADRTSSDFAQQVTLLRGLCITGGFLAVGGILKDWLKVRGYYTREKWSWAIPGLVWMAVAGGMEFGFVPTDRTEAFLEIPLSFAAVILFFLRRDLERNTDGALLTVNAVELLFLTVILLRRSVTLPAVWTLAAAGACFGTMLWCLHPAKCRLGDSGSAFLSGFVPVLCILCRFYRELALFSAVYALQQLYRIHKKENKTLTEGMEESGTQPLTRIIILAGITAFCGVMALLLKKS